ncbi:MAG: hypothetical protein P0Y53_25445 [Candidatus Pseudobacter hemicellulosilyticus]|uniref:Uncharacterized protein n=1 Tax=Candidatus Pseudobacter hemicellulosilyticus TaxID=3121375 RepID=A0AAJ5WS94_9BACT|nr:MAG: hypothetical protein P0Y53_25445 [Pseudobacter sp.]
MMGAILNIGALCLCLVPVLVIFFRQAWQSSLQPYLLAFCLVSFLHLLIRTLLPYPESHYTVVNTHIIFNLAEFLLIGMLLRAYLQTNWLKQGFTLLAVALISVQLTVYALRENIGAAHPFDLLQTLVILGMGILALAQLLREAPLNIFQLPVFWILGGILCYNSMYLLVNLLPGGNPFQDDGGPESTVFLLALLMLRAIFFTVAAASASKPATRPAPGQEPLY